jgi:hypothetical protein
MVIAYAPGAIITACTSIAPTVPIIAAVMAAKHFFLFIINPPDYLEFSTSTSSFAPSDLVIE